jgi:enoyl-CoA hydratase/carnithine racemase
VIAAPEVTVERDGPVAWVRYSNPGNCLTALGLLRLRRAVDELCAGSPPPRVIVLGGADGRSLTLMHPREGQQIAALAPPLPAWMLVSSVRAAYGLLRRSRWLRRLVLDREDLAQRTALLNLLVLQDLLESGPALSIAALAGPTMGGGMELALCCDLRLASDHPETWLAQPEVLAGVMVGFGAAARLPRLVGACRCLDLLLAAEALGPEQALSIGLVTRIFRAEHFLAEVDALAHRLASRPAAAMLGTRRAVRQGLDQPLLGAQMAELREVLRVWQSPEARQGLAQTAEVFERELQAPSGRTLPQWLAQLEPGARE